MIAPTGGLVNCGFGFGAALAAGFGAGFAAGLGLAAGFAAGFQAIQPYFDEMFLGRRPVGDTLAAAEHAANTAARR